MSENFVYCTAIIQSTGKESYDEVLKKFNNFEEITSKEDGCVSFSVVPMSSKKHEIALWEIWKDEDSFYNHHQMKHTIDLANQQLTKVKIFESSHELNL